MCIRDSPKTTHAILELIRDINQRLGITVIIITHQMSVVEEICNRVAILDSGSVVEEGVVSEVFSSPKSKAAKRLVFPDGADEILEEVPGERRIRVVFSGAVASREPLIAKMAIDEQITASILGASTKSIGCLLYTSFAVLAATLLLITIFAKYICPYDPYAQDLSQAMQPPSATHPMGTDTYGRDMLSRVLIGAQTSISSTFVLVAIITVVGTVVGIFCGYYGGIVDSVMMRISDICLAFPGLVFAMAVAAILSGGVPVSYTHLLWTCGYSVL